MEFDCIRYDVTDSCRPVLEPVGLMRRVALGETLRIALWGNDECVTIRVPRGAAGPDADTLRSELRTRLSAYKVPQRVAFLPDDEVPMLSSGKLDARALKEQFVA